MATERTLVLVKPDGVRRGLAGEVISRLEQKGLTLVAMELRTLAKETAEQHYAEHSERPFFGELVDFITDGPLVALVVEGPNAVVGTRRLMGVTNPVEATPG
ncbi:MAG: Nucleoside-diphosphate kinase, partial [Frankiales bacterium]|nr:Nucleoside-diphosphate kinase [Frankiales bacterium]